MNDWNVIGQLLAIVTTLTAAGGMIYALGLIGLAISIHLRITDDVSTAWYAVSLLSKIIVVGQGARIWFIWPFILTVAMLLVAVVMSVVNYRLVPLEWKSEKTAPIAIALLLGIPLIVASILSHQIQRRVTREEAQVRAQVPARAEQLLPWIGSYTIAIGAALYAEPNEFINVSLSVAVLIIFVGSLILGARTAMSVKLPLPVVAISMKPQNPRQLNPTWLRGILVTHRDSFWHLFNENNELVSIPDEQVLAVRTGGEIDTLSAGGTANTEDSQ